MTLREEQELKELIKDLVEETLVEEGLGKYVAGKGKDFLAQTAGLKLKQIDRAIDKKVSGAAAAMPGMGEKAGIDIAKELIKDMGSRVLVRKSKEILSAEMNAELKGNTQVGKMLSKFGKKTNAGIYLMVEAFIKTLVDDADSIINWNIWSAKAQQKASELALTKSGKTSSASDADDTESGLDDSFNNEQEQK